jgi:hypothetical protein
MLEIRSISVTSAEGKSRLSADIIQNGESHPLWFEVEEKYGKYLCKDRSDAFVAALLFVALKTRQDIKFEIPITRDLKDSITNDFIDIICQHQPELYRVRLIGPVEDSDIKVRSEKAIGAGCSCGVDCMYTVMRRMADETRQRYLLLTDMHGAVQDDSEEKLKWRREYLHTRASGFAKEFNIPLIICKTNFDYSGISDLHFEGCTTYGNLFSVLALQKLFERYYIASGGPVVDFAKYLHNGIYGTDCSNYDLLTCQAFSTRELKFIVDGLEDRTIKIRALCKWPPAWKHLDVCHVHSIGNWRNGTNDCPKCMYTILAILAQGEGELEKFKDVFDIDYVKSHKYQYAAELLRKRIIRAETAMESWPYRKNMGFSTCDWIMGGWIVVKKIVKKILRGGRTQSKDFSAEG